MKKIMILGGGPNQIGLLKAAKKCRYIVILCDKNPNCIGRSLSDSFYEVDTIDDEKLLKIAIKEKIDGVISNSEAIMENVAIIASELGLRGNSRESISILNSKEMFRDFQQEIGLYAPKHAIVENIDELSNMLSDFEFPIIVKPVKCSGTRGTEKFESLDVEKIRETVNSCMNYSRNKKCSIEEYVEMSSLIVLEGDVFLNQGKIFFGGLFFTQRSKELPMVPMTYMSPYIDSQKHMRIIEKTLIEIFDKLKIRHGQYNIEAYFNKDDLLFIIEINARQGGHGLPAYVKLATGIDLDKALVTTAVGDDEYFDNIMNEQFEQKYATRHTIFGNKDGILNGLYISEDIRPYVVSIELEKKIGDSVEKRKNGSSYIGFVNLVFENYELQHKYSENIEDYIYPIIR
ncbi:ATP-grasp domain-containing protein [Blautia obeum]|uniref:ATP-grasp domain-containing protein n=1 Tax=Blautia obeum TaxID=40520 RepID=A0A395X6E0_9FIRM|nr:ATP-grasp domain-containing protein [Blautia obeum]MZT69692.1 ATP-grasp domain-containing protein [Blautia obeum]RGK94314.1 ATP-grasp domain-containing protein [Blautia obeum]RGV22171.1 ATP-grasp domain-containing protein [Blautia obeum]RGV63451.1 ATP-grasp domain-containing protein [Blautia obeum]RYT65809.1 ATP-grasp domain-containing protein [Blautia obeum]